MSKKKSKNYPRQKTNYPGVFFRENSKSKKYFIFDIYDRVKEKSLRINFPDMDGLQQGQTMKELKELKEPITVTPRKD